MGWFSDLWGNGIADGLLNPTKSLYDSKKKREAAKKANAAANAQPATLAGNKAYIEG